VTALNPPHGGTLVNLLVDEARALELKQHAREWPSWDLTARQICDLELLLDGGFSPLRGFMTEAEHASVCRDMRLTDGTLWPMPITLDVTAEVAESLEPGSKLALRDAEGVMLAVLDVEDVYEPDRLAEAEAVFGTANGEHPGVDHLLRHSNPFYIGGTIEGLARPLHYDFTDRRLTPAQLRERFEERGWDRIVAFQTRNPMHRAHQELTLRAAQEQDAALLIHPVVGMTKPGDVDHYTRVRCYEALLDTYPDHLAELSLLPLAMRMGGPREALWHAIIRKNFGCTHLIVGRDHAGPGSDSTGEPFYGPYDAQELLTQHTDELGIEMVPFRLMVYLPGEERYAPIDEVPESTETASISGTQLREKLQTGEAIPEWFTFPAVAAELRRTHPPRDEQGFTVFFTGLSGSGKSTIANVLQSKLLELGGRSITMLDGDLVRKHLSSELGFSKEHRDLNIQRIGFVASQVTKHGGTAICAPIAPYAHTRQDVRDLVEAAGGFILVFVDTPLEVCEERDRKGLYAKARAGIIKEFTGISDPYEAPTDAEITIDTTSASPEEAAAQIIGYLKAEGYLSA
jgi:sulfate adenylyltransferase